MNALGGIDFDFGYGRVVGDRDAYVCVATKKKWGAVGQAAPRPSGQSMKLDWTIRKAEEDSVSS